MADHMDERTPTRPSLQSSSFEGSADTLTFFADAQLDLDEAHDIADTPEATKLPSNLRGIIDHERIQLPSLTIAEEEEEPIGESVLTSGGGTAASMLGDADKDDFSRITGENHLEISQRLVIKKRKPRWPRDIPWTIAFLATVPTTMLVASSTGTSTTPVSIHTIVATSLVNIVLVQWIYRSAAGGEGDDVRQRVVTFLSWAAPMSAIVMYACLFVVLVRRSIAGSLLPLMALIRDVYSVRRWHRPGTGASGYASRIGTFQAVTAMALDILSRSLRHRPLVRNVYFFGALQVLLILWWRHALQRHPLAAVVAGKWATAVITRCLSYLSSAAVMYWCASQQQMTQQQQSTDFSNGGDDFDEDDLPEAYRTVDASVYQSVTTAGDEMGFIQEDEDDLMQEVMQESPSSPNGDVHQQQQQHRHTIKSILWNGISLSFGSIAACGLLGGSAQFAWSQLRRLPQTNVTTFIQQNLVNRYNDLAMTHVAMSYKGYVRSARDVAAIMEASGTFL